MNVSYVRWSAVMLLCASGFLAGCDARAPAADPTAPAAVTASKTVTPTADVQASAYKPTATFQEIMDSVLDMSADHIWKAVSSSVDKTGVHEIRPHTAEEWHEFRRRAVLLSEAANLIAVPGRRVANGDRTIETNDPLPVAEIQKRIDTQRDQLLGFSAALRSVSSELVAAADRKDVEAIMTLGGTLDEVCEACHRVFWYPEANQPRKN